MGTFIVRHVLQVVLVLAVVDVVTAGSTAACSKAALSPGDHHFNITYGKEGVRPYIIHIPKSYNGTDPISLVFALHGKLLHSELSQQLAVFIHLMAVAGLGENYPDNFQKEIPLWDKQGEVEGYATVYPLGSNSISTQLFGHTWNAGHCCFSNADDIGFLIKLHEVLQEQLCFNTSRVYAMGFSAGGMMSNRLACEAPDKFAAVASVSGVLEVKAPCNASKPYLHFHGLLDPISPFAGDGFTKSVASTMDNWVKNNDCSDKYNQTYSQYDVRAHSWLQCAADRPVELVIIDFGGHAWPPAAIQPEQWIWNHLSRHSLE